jgi:hypothetical protein
VAAGFSHAEAAIRVLRFEQRTADASEAAGDKDANSAARRHAPPPFPVVARVRRRNVPQTAETST